MSARRRWPLARPVESMSQATGQVGGGRFTPTLRLIHEDIR
jgi:hypothetical protein